jgi:hypothetical protein
MQSRHARRFLRQEAARLMAPQLGVVAFQAQQFLMRALLHDAALLQHDEPVHARDGGQTVRNRDHGFAFHQAQQLVLDGHFHFAVQGRCRLVQHQDGRVFQHHSGNRHALTLTAAELHTALAYLGLVAGAVFPVLQVGDEVVRLRFARRRFYLGLRGTRSAVADVGGDGAVQQ